MHLAATLLLGAAPSPAEAQERPDSLRAEVARLSALVDSLAAQVARLTAAGQTEAAGDALARLRVAAGTLFAFLEENEYEGAPIIDQLDGWLGRAAPFRGRQIICYQKNWAYFQERFQVTCADYVEAKPGIPSTPGHVADLIVGPEDGARAEVARPRTRARVHSPGWLSIPSSLRSAINRFGMMASMIRQTGRPMLTTAA